MDMFIKRIRHFLSGSEITAGTDGSDCKTANIFPVCQCNRHNHAAIFYQVFDEESNEVLQYITPQKFVS